MQGCGKDCGHKADHVHPGHAASQSACMRSLKAFHRNPPSWRAASPSNMSFKRACMCNVHLASHALLMRQHAQARTSGCLAMRCTLLKYNWKLWTTYTCKKFPTTTNAPVRCLPLSPRRSLVPDHTSFGSHSPPASAH
eukprot:359972-Chlamydomonas_euryale.AAC.4